MDARELLIVALVAVLFLPAPIYCAAQRPRWPFFVGLVAGLVAGAIGGFMIGLLLLAIFDAMHPGDLAQMGASIVLVPAGIGLVGGGCLGMWLGILVWGRAQAKSRSLAR